MVLSFGTYANLLKICSRKGVYNKTIVKTLVDTIDHKNHYGDQDGKNDVSIHRLMSGKGDFPNIQVAAGLVRETAGAVTTITTLARYITLSELKDKFEPIIKLLDEDKKRALVGAIRYLVEHDESLRDMHHSLFFTCTGKMVNDFIKTPKINLQRFLAGVFLYTVKLNENTKRHDDILLIQKEEFIQQFLDYEIEFTDPDDPDDIIITPPHPPVPAKYVRYKLDGLEENYEFDVPPCKVNIILLYFITLYSDNEYYALIDYVSYSHSALENSDTATEKKTYAGNIWSVPYIITTINNVSVRNVKEARSAFDKVLQQTYQEAYYEHHISIKEKLSILEEELFHRLGIVDKELINGEKYIEYVQSLGDTTKFECNYVMEFFVRNIDRDGILNLADPTGLHNHNYFPLSLTRHMPIRNGLYSFMSKPIPNNIYDVFLFSRDKLVENVVTVPKSDLAHRHKGVLFKIAISNSHRIFMTSTPVRSNIDRLITTVLGQAPAYHNVDDYVLDGYQITGVMPDDPIDLHNILELLYEAFAFLFHDFGLDIIIRCTAHSCEYEYGKFLEICPYKNGFVGQDYDTLCLMAHETKLAQKKMKRGTNGILFGWATEDSDAAKFAPKGGKAYEVQNSTELNRKMSFVFVDKGVFDDMSDIKFPFEAKRTHKIQ